MNRYWLFAGERFYPSGGFNDYIKSADTVEELKAHVEENAHGANEIGVFVEWYWGQIVDTQTAKEVISFECDEYRAEEITFTWEEPEDG